MRSPKEKATCDRCKAPIELKASRLDRSQITKQSFFYIAYYGCTSCGNNYLHEKFKIRSAQLDDVIRLLNEGIPVEKVVNALRERRQTIMYQRGFLKDV
jgi:superfamily II helicase